MVGEYAVIDYGDFNDPSSPYQSNKAIDAAAGGYFNSTLW